MRVNPSSLRRSEPLIRALLPTLRNVDDAYRELSWLRRELDPSKSLYKACVLRGKGYPLQYILGTQPFGPLSIKCSRKVLIPRWETEEWVTALARDPSVQNGRVLDLCTGSGCILFLLAKLANCSGVATDLSPYARKLFLENQRLLKLQSSTEFLFRNVFEPLPADTSFDIVTANPPYVSGIRDLENSVRMFEPRLALMEPKNIFSAIVDRVIESGARKSVIELGDMSQAQETIHKFKHYGWKAETRNDSAGRLRTVWAHKN